MAIIDFSTRRTMSQAQFDNLSFSDRKRLKEANPALYRRLLLHIPGKKEQRSASECCYCNCGERETGQFRYRR